MLVLSTSLGLKIFLNGFSVRKITMSVDHVQNKNLKTLDFFILSKF